MNRFKNKEYIEDLPKPIRESLYKALCKPDYYSRVNRELDVFSMCMESGKYQVCVHNREELESLFDLLIDEFNEDGRYELGCV